jgi:hypothetical protein
MSPPRGKTIAGLGLAARRELGSQRSAVFAFGAQARAGSRIEAERLGGLLLCDALDAPKPRVVTAISPDGTAVLCAPLD